MSALAIFDQAFNREVDAFLGLDELAALTKIGEAAEWDAADPSLPLAEALLRAAEKGSLPAAAALTVLSRTIPELEQTAVKALSAVARRSPEVQQQLVVAGAERLVEEECERQGMIREERDGQVFYRRPGGAS